MAHAQPGNQRSPQPAEQAVKRVPGDLGLHLLLAETWLEQGDNEQALKILKEYRKQRPDSELVQQELGILYVKTGHFKDADKVFSALPQRLRTSFVRYAHAQALVGLKQPHRAIQQLRLAVLLANCYRNSLRLAAENGCHTVDFPSISTGIYRFPLDQAAQIAVREITRYLADHPEMTRVRMVCFDSRTYAAYAAALAAQECAG